MNRQVAISHSLVSHFNEQLTFSQSSPLGEWFINFSRLNSNKLIVDGFLADLILTTFKLERIF